MMAAIAIEAVLPQIVAILLWSVVVVDVLCVVMWLMLHCFELWMRDQQRRGVLIPALEPRAAARVPARAPKAVPGPLIYLNIAPSDPTDNPLVHSIYHCPYLCGPDSLGH